MITPDPRGVPGRVNTTDRDRWIVLKQQRHEVGLTTDEREEYKRLAQKFNEVKHGTVAADA